MNCLFCQIATGKAPAKIFYEDEQVIVFNDINPRAPIHLLICPKEHYHDFIAAPPEVHKLLADTVKLVSERLKAQGEHFRLIINNGSRAGQIVFHLHYHLLAGK